MVAPSKSTAGRARILVVDDDPIFTSVACACLESAGFEPHVAADGAEAIARLEQESFAAALIDLSMPKVDGFRLIAVIRGLSRLKHLPLIVASARNDVVAIEEAYALGANAFQTKPINWAMLAPHIRFVLRTAGTIEALQRRVEELTAERATPSLLSRPAAGDSEHTPQA